VAEAESTAATRESRLKRRFMVALWGGGGGGEEERWFLGDGEGKLKGQGVCSRLVVRGRGGALLPAL
jgi:hypothetical protein